MIRKIVSFFTIVIFAIAFPSFVKAYQLDSIDIRGTLYDQRADFNIFYGVKTDDDALDSTIITNVLNTDMTPIFQQYEFYTPLYVDKWFHDYGYNPLKNINEMCQNIINNDFGIDIKVWAYKSMYLSLKTANKVVPETRFYINNNLGRLAKNSDYLFSLIRMEKLLKQVTDNLKTNANYYKINSVPSEHNAIFNSYLQPIQAPSGNASYRAIGETFPNNITVPTDDNDLKVFYTTLVNETTNKKMIDDNTTMYYLNIKKDYNITLTLNEDGMYEYDSDSFFIADNFGIGDDLDPGNSTNHFWNDDGVTHNYNFTYKMKLDFKPNIGSEFTFTGDDDVWVFISEKDDPTNNFKVIDLGGIHVSQTASFKFEEGANNTLECYVKERDAGLYNTHPLSNVSLDPNQVYTLYLFFSERRPTGSSFKIVTDIEILQSNTPIFENNEMLSFKSTSDNTITKRLGFIPSENSIFRLYKNETGTETDDNVTFEIVGNDIILTFNEIPIESKDYYLTIQNSNEKESNRVKLTVNPYVENPKTSDEIVSSIIFLTLSLICFICLTNNKKRDII